LKILRSVRVKDNLKSIKKGEEATITEVNGLNLKVKTIKKREG